MEDEEDINGKSRKQEVEREERKRERERERKLPVVLHRSQTKSA